MESITADQYSAFLADFNYEQATDSRRVLKLSFAFLRTLPFCEGAFLDSKNAPVIAEAQSFIAYAMSEEGGGFDPTEVADSRIAVREGLGRDALEDEYEVNPELIGTDPMSLIKRVPLAFGLLKELLCEDGNSNGTSQIKNFDVIR